MKYQYKETPLILICANNLKKLIPIYMELVRSLITLANVIKEAEA